MASAFSKELAAIYYDDATLRWEPSFLAADHVLINFSVYPFQVISLTYKRYTQTL